MKHFENTLKILILSILIVLSGSLVENLKAQNGRNCKSQQKNVCLNIPNLTESQTTTINSLQTSHKQEMDVLREKRRNAQTTEEKDNIRKEMDNKILSHKNDVRKILDKDQLEYFNTNSRNNNSCGNNGKRSGNGNCANKNSAGRR